MDPGVWSGNVEAWVLIPIVAIVMWGVQGVARALRGLPEPRSRHRSRGHRAYDAVGEVSGADEAVRAELDELRQRVAELEELRPRVTELEERQDFTERVLTRGSHDGDAGRSHAS